METCYSAHLNSKRGVTCWIVAAAADTTIRQRTADVERPLRGMKNANVESGMQHLAQIPYSRDCTVFA